MTLKTDQNIYYRSSIFFKNALNSQFDNNKVSVIPDKVFYITDSGTFVIIVRLLENFIVQIYPLNNKIIIIFYDGLYFKVISKVEYKSEVNNGKNKCQN